MKITTKATLIAAFTVCSSMTMGLLARELIITPRLIAIERHADLRDITRFEQGMERYRHNLSGRIKRIFAAAGLLQSLGGDIDWHPILLQMAKIGGYEELDYFILSDDAGKNAVLQSGELVDKNQSPPNARAMNEILNHVLPRLDYTKGSMISGFMSSASDGPLLYAAGRATWTSTRLPEVYIAIRRLTPEMITQFAEQLGLRAQRIGSAELLEELHRYEIELGQRSGEDTLYSIFNDDDGMPLLHLRFTTDPRAFDDQVFSPGVMTALGFAVLTWIALLYLAHRSFIRPLLNITATMRAIRQDNNYREKLVYRNNDELGKLVDECNELLRHVAEHTSQLETYSYSDALTGIGNRRLFQERLDYQWKLAKRKGMSISAIVFDLDYFKQFNDYYGHEGGDQVLQRFASLLLQIFCRDTDVIARTGGEEFTVLLIDVEEAPAKCLGEALIEALRDQKIVHRGSPRNETLSVSAGLATMIPDSGSSPETLIRRADAALYIAKHEGRDQICSHSDDCGNNLQKFSTS